jgi:hypothetical protein
VSRGGLPSALTILFSARRHIQYRGSRLQASDSVFVERHEPVVGFVDDGVQSYVKGEHDDNDDPSGYEVDEKTCSIGGEPAPLLC